MKALKALAVVAIVAIVAAVAWFFREPLLQKIRSFKGASTVESAVRPEPAVPRKDTVYRWVDADGVPHFEQRPVEGSEAVVIDQGKIRSMEAETSASGSPVVTLPPGEDSVAE